MSSRLYDLSLIPQSRRVHPTNSRNTSIKALHVTKIQKYVFRLLEMGDINLGIHVLLYFFKKSSTCLPAGFVAGVPGRSASLMWQIYRRIWPRTNTSSPPPSHSVAPNKILFLRLWPAPHFSRLRLTLLSYHRSYRMVGDTRLGRAPGLPTIKRNTCYKNVRNTIVVKLLIEGAVKKRKRKKIECEASRRKYADVAKKQMEQSIGKSLGNGGDIFWK